MTKQTADSNYILFVLHTYERALKQCTTRDGENIPRIAHCPYPLKDPTHRMECFFDL